MVFTTTACGYKTAELIWTDYEHASVLRRLRRYFPGYCATFGVQAVRVLALASALARAGKFLGVPDTDHAECVSDGLLVILHVPIGSQVAATRCSTLEKI